MSKSKKTTKKKKTTRKKKASGLVKITSPVKKDAQFFVASELADDRLIGQELLGQTSKGLVYEYENKDGDKIQGLSYLGVREAVRVINRDRKSGHIIQVSDKPPIIQRDVTMYGQEGVEVQVYAIDIEGGGGLWGMKFEPWQRIVDGNGSTEYNRFALETALSKAQRNAMFGLLPAHLVEDVIKKFAKDKEQVVKLDAPKETTRAVKAKKTADDKLYRATLDRVGKISDNKVGLEQTLEKVDKMPLNARQRATVRRKITGYLKKL
jgi:hypothetical protein